MKYSYVRSSRGHVVSVGDGSRGTQLPPAALVEFPSCGLVSGARLGTGAWQIFQ
jgi:hypothetical protein